MTYDIWLYYLHWRNTDNNKPKTKRNNNKKGRDNSNTNSNNNTISNNKPKAKRNNSNRIEWDKIISNSHNNKIVYDSVINHRKHKNDKTVNNDNNNSNTTNSLKNTEVRENSTTPISCADYIYYEKFQIGIGSFGKVFCGKNKTTNNKVAIKVPNEDKVNKAASDQEIRYTKMMEKEQGFPILYHTYLIDKKSIRWKVCQSYIYGNCKSCQIFAPNRTLS